MTEVVGSPCPFCHHPLSFHSDHLDCGELAMTDRVRRYGLLAILEGRAE